MKRSMNRETYINSINKGELTAGIYFTYYDLLGGNLDEADFSRYFPQFYQLVPHIHPIINNRVIAVMDSHYKVNIVKKDGNIIKRY